MKKADRSKERFAFFRAVDKEKGDTDEIFLVSRD